jgi:putative ABC transport system permease protein
MNVSRVDLGIRKDNLVTFGLSPQLNNYRPERASALFDRVEEELAGIPGVTGVTASMVPLVSGSNWMSDVSVEGFEAPPDTNRTSSLNTVGPGYFRTLGVPVLAGRDFDERDAGDTAKVAIVNEAFARKFGMGDRVVGRRMAIGHTSDLDIEIIGLVPDTKYNQVKQAAPPLFFQPYKQSKSIGFLTFYVRTTLPQEQLLSAIPGVVAQLDPNLPVERLKTMAAHVKESVYSDRLVTTLSLAFALLATILAAVGLYGVLAYTVANRTREIGLRMALGAAPGSVRGMVLAQMGWMVLVGTVLGLGAAIGLGRLASSLLFELEAYDPAVLVGSAVALAVVALLAAVVPAYKASLVEPIRALRYE